MRLKDKIAIVAGAGQTPGETIGNDRASAILFARDGSKVMLMDRDINPADETRKLISDENGESFTFAADISREADCRKMADPKQKNLEQKLACLDQRYFHLCGRTKPEEDRVDSLRCNFLCLQVLKNSSCILVKVMRTPIHQHLMRTRADQQTDVGTYS